MLSSQIKLDSYLAQFDIFNKVSDIIHNSETALGLTLAESSFEEQKVRELYPLAVELRDLLVFDFEWEQKHWVKFLIELTMSFRLKGRKLSIITFLSSLGMKGELDFIELDGFNEISNTYQIHDSFASDGTGFTSKSVIPSNYDNNSTLIDSLLYEADLESYYLLKIENVNTEYINLFSRKLKDLLYRLIWMKTNRSVVNIEVQTLNIKDSNKIVVHSSLLGVYHSVLSNVLLGV